MEGTNQKRDLAKYSIDFTQTTFNFRKNSNPRSCHIKTVKIGLSLFVVFILSYTPFIYIVTFGKLISGYFAFAFYNNNLANFLIYLFVDEEFRAKLRARYTPCM